MPLHIAAYEGKVDEVKELLSNGANVDEPNDSGWTAMMWAARGGQPEVMKVLNDEGADLYAQNKFGSTPLHAAAHWGNAQATELLLGWIEAGKIDTTNAFGWTALHWAGKGGHPAVSGRACLAWSRLNGGRG